MVQVVAVVAVLVQGLHHLVAAVRSEHAAGRALAVAAAVYPVVTFFAIGSLDFAVAAVGTIPATRCTLAVPAGIDAVVALLAKGGLDYGVAAVRRQLAV